MARSENNTALQAGEELLPGLSLGVTLRTSPRAKNLLLRLVPGLGLEIVLPYGVPESAARGLIERKRAWIERTAARLRAQGADLSGTPAPLPEALPLRALGRELPLALLTRQGRMRLTQNGERLVLSGPLDTPEGRVRAMNRLREFVRTEAKTHLPAQLRAESTRTGLTFDEVSIRCQRARWGSCSISRGSARISLNAKLLFLPPELCTQVLLHELCHTKRPDHSRAFAVLMARHNPEAPRLERELSSAWRFVPDWWREATQ